MHSLPISPKEHSYFLSSNSLRRLSGPDNLNFNVTVQVNPFGIYQFHFHEVIFTGAEEKVDDEPILLPLTTSTNYLFSYPSGQSE